ncbi:class I SAM-dependent methyltransferase [Starkeya koreensis]|uniref:Class I SAM-dependent methyltransferase n=1 Tax=Ancylobacter koreensis TaxID=266121 RepID=A0ABT0DL08_9HYPH|nr:class I SAM-dependent methyltransferase [Ancylobacter koreensis]MCK0207976.1 class I SAM-dependent methyltransferase [Ancylobacter koreensis]
MSGFDAGWLALREPADHAARNAEVAAAVGAHFAGRAALTIVDLGCGSGSNLRALAPLLPARQHWHLVDGDPALLAEARHRLAGWADSVREANGGLRLDRGGRAIRVTFERADLTARDLHFHDIAPDLVTAAALFDLVSAGWLERLVAASATRRRALYAVLNYDGAACWEPSSPLDTAIRDAFNRHQRGDKGFGPALGPDACDALAELLARHGYRVRQGASPWRLGPADGALIAAVSAGVAVAACEMEPGRSDAFADWGRARAEATGAVIGHRDIFAVP